MQRYDYRTDIVEVSDDSEVIAEFTKNPTVTCTANTQELEEGIGAVFGQIEKEGRRVVSVTPLVGSLIMNNSKKNPVVVTFTNGVVITSEKQMEMRD